jgi:hypothetical protein
MRFQLPNGLPLKGGRMFLTRGSVVDDASGSFHVTYAPDSSHLGELLPGGWIVPPDAVPLDQTAYNTQRALHPNRVIVTHSPVGITRTPDL